VTLHVNSIAGARYKNKSESSNHDRNNIVFRSRRNISIDGASRSRTAADWLFNVRFQSFVVP